MSGTKLVNYTIFSPKMLLNNRFNWLVTGFILLWDAVLSLPLIPIFLWILERRFIIHEESTLRRTFRADYARYERRVRRWI